MNDFCNKCGLCCKLIPAYDGNIIRDGFQQIEEFFEPINIADAMKINEEFVKSVQNIFPDAEFYTCKYLSEENLCSNTNPPDNCKNFPSSPIAIISENCGYYGEIFIKNETLKQKIRKLKEDIIHYESLIIENPKEKNGYQKIIKSHQNYINRFISFGSQNW